MTEKQMDKFVGKKVCIKIHTFPHSVEVKTHTGILMDPYEDEYYCMRGGVMKSYTHHSYFLDEGQKYLFPINWNDLKLIVSIKELEDRK